MSEQTILISILTAIIAVLYLIAVRIRQVYKEIECMHQHTSESASSLDSIGFMIAAVLNFLEVPAPIESDDVEDQLVESPFEKWDEG